MFDTAPTKETAVLIGLATRNQSYERVQEYLEELAFLVDTAGGVVDTIFIQKLDLPDSRTYVGKGKMEEITAYIEEHEIDMAVFDDELSPSQIRNIERILNCKILDRNNLILDIFARRAATSHARTQVELAQCEYMLPRLTRMWTHLEKQRGGIGLRGPGEQEIETDRRILRYRISLLKEKLEDIDKQQATQRKNRRGMIRVALVGYTNVGKSTLMNLLSKSDIFAENKLFATLDTTVRKMVIHDLPFLLSDTVGFIRKLPHTLIESFKSTLDEVREADLLIHLVDISHRDFEEQIFVVKQTLGDIGASNKPVIMVFNKIDNYTPVIKEEDDLTPAHKGNMTLEELENTWMAKDNLPSLFISATEKLNIDELKELIYTEVKKLRELRYPPIQG
jgi:GTPase